jgi:hypothetical protein
VHSNVSRGCVYSIRRVGSGCQYRTSIDIRGGLALGRSKDVSNVGFGLGKFIACVYRTGNVSCPVDLFQIWREDQIEQAVEAVTMYQRLDKLYIIQFSQDHLHVFKFEMRLCFHFFGVERLGGSVGSIVRVELIYQPHRPRLVTSIQHQSEETVLTILDLEFSKVLVGSSSMLCEVQGILRTRCVGHYSLNSFKLG